MAKSLVTFDGPERWALHNSDVPLAKRKQQEGRSTMVWAGIVDQTINRLFKVDEGVKLNSANYCDFMKTLFVGYKFRVSK